MKKTILILLMSALLGMTANAEDLITDEPLTKAYAVERVNVREGPSTSYPIVYTLNTEERVLVDSATSETWVKIYVGDVSGYVCSRYIQIEYDLDLMPPCPYNEQVPMSFELQQYLWEQCYIRGINYYFALGTIDLESNFKPTAVHHNSNGTTDRGICQTNSCWNSTLKSLGYITCSDDLYDAFVGIRCGMWELGKCVAKYGNTEKAYVFYNTGNSKIESNKASRIVMQNWAKWESIINSNEIE